MAGAAGCVPVAPPPPPPSALEVSASPSLFPAFDPSVTDYVSRCGDGAPVQVTIGAPDGTAVSVAGRPWSRGRFTTTASRAAGQAFAIVVRPPSKVLKAYYVRCLPLDFPAWSASHTGATRAQHYMATPFELTSFGALGAYPTIFDANGVPVWWAPKAATYFTTLLPNGNVASLINGGFEERKLDGTLVRTVSGLSADAHDLLLLPSGNYIMVVNENVSGQDLTELGGPVSATVLNHVIKEVDPLGVTVKSWNVMDHIPVTEMNPQWYPEVITAGPTSGGAYDVYHWNSIEDSGDGHTFILSFRHLDALYKIDIDVGAPPSTVVGEGVVWKLGATASPTTPALTQLSVVGDPVYTGGSHFGGQHDARILADGTLSLYDNGSGLGRPPRGARYAIDETTGTATLQDAVSDPQIPRSFCCGSARRLSASDWVIGWGGNGTGTESVNGLRGFAITYASQWFVYRFVPILPGTLDPAELRAAMDIQFGGGGLSAAEARGSDEPIPNLP